MVIKRGRAFTLIEMIVVIGIIIILASVTFPMITRAFRSAKESKTLSNLRQLFVATNLYREANDAKADVGDRGTMGLPPIYLDESVHLKVAPAALWRSPCCCNIKAPRVLPNTEREIDYSILFHDNELWEIYTKKNESRSVLYADFHCNDSNHDIYSPINPVHGVGVRLDGSIDSRTKRITAADWEHFWR